MIYDWKNLYSPIGKFSIIKLTEIYDLRFGDRKRMYLNITYSGTILTSIIKTRYTQKWLSSAGFTESCNLFCQLSSNILFKLFCIVFVVFFTISSNFRHSFDRLLQFVTRYLRCIYLIERIPRYIAQIAINTYEKYISSITCSLIATLRRSLAASVSVKSVSTA